MLAIGCRDRDVWTPRFYPPVVINTSSIPNGVVGQPYVFTLRATGGDGRNYVWKLINGTTLPDGLTLDPNTGVISGTPTTATPAGSPSLVIVREQRTSWTWGTSGYSPFLRVNLGHPREVTSKSTATKRRPGGDSAPQVHS